MGRDDFMVSPANSNAVALVDHWPQWPAYGAIIAGPAGSGKTHLAMVWQKRSGAGLIAATDLRFENVPQLLAGNALVIENVDQGAVPERALFHLLNLAREQGAHVLLTARLAPGLWNIRLPDLTSRLLVLPLATIAAPDDDLLRVVLVKHFADRQIAVDEALISYLLARMPRSLEMARTLVAQIDALALAEKAEVTRSFAGRVLAALESPEML